MSGLLGTPLHSRLTGSARLRLSRADHDETLADSE
jgi:hypothetical protein